LPWTWVQPSDTPPALPRRRATGDYGAANRLHYEELVLSGSYSETLCDFQAAQALIQSGRFPADRMVTHTLTLDAITTAFPLMESGEALKVSIYPSAIPIP